MPLQNSATNDTHLRLGPGTRLMEESEYYHQTKLNGINMIATKFGDFIRVGKQSIFNESEIACELEQIGFNTNQIIVDYGIFLRKDFSK